MTIALIELVFVIGFIMIMAKLLMAIIAIFPLYKFFEFECQYYEIKGGETKRIYFK